jgi:uncharacterized protein (TIGR00369 family)
MPDLAFEQAAAILAAQPFSGLLGAELTAFGDGAATIELELRTDLTQQNGFAHGGVLSYAADNAITFAAGSVLGPQVLTAGFSIEYLRPATGRRLVAVAEVVEATRSRASVSCRVSSVGDDGTSRVCAVALGTVAAVTPAQNGG